GREEHVGELRDAVLMQAGEARGRAADGLEVDAIDLVMRPARDVDDARRRGRLDPIEQQLGEQEVADVIDAELEFETVLGEPALTGDARVVDEDRQRQIAGEEDARRAAHRGERREIELEELDLLVTAVALDALDGFTALLLAPAGDEDVGA